jgi:hypothetical protein
VIETIRQTDHVTAEETPEMHQTQSKRTPHETIKNITRMTASMKPCEHNSKE